MAIISTCLSTSRPSPGVHGDLLLESDTKKLAMYDSVGGWHTYARSGFQWTNSPAGQLTYAGGTFATPGSGTYDLGATQPAIHLDAQMLDGINQNTTDYPGAGFTGTGGVASAAAGDQVFLWKDRSGNGRDFTYNDWLHSYAPLYTKIGTNAAVDFSIHSLYARLWFKDPSGNIANTPSTFTTATGYDINAEYDMGSGNRTEILVFNRNAAWSGSHSMWNTRTGSGSNHVTWTTTQGANASFPGTPLQGIPFGATIYSPPINTPTYMGLMSSPPSVWMSSYTDAEATVMADNTWGSDKSTSVMIFRRDGNDNELYQNGNWLLGAYNTGASSTLNIAKIGGAGNFKGSVFEMMAFDDALDATDLNTVLSYLQNKYPDFGAVTGVPTF